MMKGHVGNPTGKGNLDGKNRNKNLPWKAAINRALIKKGKCEQAEELYLIAREVVECAQDRTDPNFKFAVQEIGQRLDGKAVETVELGDDTQKSLGISAALGLLAEFTRREEAVVGEVIVPDRPILSSEVCASEGGHGEGVDIPEVSGSSSQS
tara:strand:+ start:13393 stop:13851 length:459 start_codon:yes stop_codon:yes gene_type:complete